MIMTYLIAKFVIKKHMFGLKPSYNPNKVKHTKNILKKGERGGGVKRFKNFQKI